VLAGEAAAGIAVVHQPILSLDLAHQDHDVVIAHGRHAGGGPGARKLPHPGGSEIELAADLAEHVERRLAAAELGRAARRSSADDCRVAIGIDCGRVSARRASVVTARLRYDTVRAAALVADDQRLAGLASVVMSMPVLSDGGRRDQAGKERRDENGSVLYQFNLIDQERRAAARTASPLVFV